MLFRSRWPWNNLHSVLTIAIVYKTPYCFYGEVWGLESKWEVQDHDNPACPSRPYIMHSACDKKITIAEKLVCKQLVTSLALLLAKRCHM